MTDTRETIDAVTDIACGVGNTYGGEVLYGPQRNCIELGLRRLTSAGYRILGPDEVDAVTVACEEALPYVSRYESENFSNVALDTVTKLSTAIRALSSADLQEMQE